MIRECKQCGKLFEHPNVRKKYCCDTCKNAAGRKKPAEGLNIPPRSNLDSYSPEELLHYGKLSLQRQLKAMERERNLSPKER